MGYVQHIRRLICTNLRTTRKCGAFSASFLNKGQKMIIKYKLLLGAAKSNYNIGWMGRRVELASAFKQLLFINPKSMVTTL